MGFVPLHVHSEHSHLDALCKIKDMVAKAVEYQMPAIALTDHGNMFGAIEFYKECTAKGIKPIIGCEVYIAPSSRFEHDKDNRYYHLVLLCENEIGYRNLCYLVSQGYLTGRYYKPRIDKELLEEYHEGLICLSACMSGEIPKLILAGEYDKAKETALWYSDLFGKDRFYLEMQDHGHLDQPAINRGLRRIASETGIPMVVTNDSHYLNREDSYLQEILFCISDKKTLDEDHQKYCSDEFYFKSEAEMRERFPDDDVAFNNTVKIAEMCDFHFTFGEYHLPAFVPPAPYTNDSYFEHLCWEGFKARYPENKAEDREQMEYEIGVIRKMGYVNYFLIVADYINFAKQNHIPVGPGRGSAAGSMVTYCMGITDVDPRKYSLYFERFLNPERVSMPDIDVDFCMDRRQEVMDYVTQKYGADHVAQIITFNTMKAKSAIRDVARVLGFEYAQADRLSKMISKTDLHATIDSTLESNPEFKALYDGNEEIHNLIDIARKIEALPRQVGTHAAAVVIASAPVYEFAPLAVNNDVPVIQYNMVEVEEIGLLKMDFLGLRNLTVMENAVDLIRKNHPGFDLSAIPEDDQEVYRMLSDGSTSGVFQLESEGMTQVCKELKPTSIEDLTALVALYRPGPMDNIPQFIQNKHAPMNIQYSTPLLKPILDVTYGITVYQEQVIDIFRNIGGYSLGQADNIRRAISKKKEAVILAERKAFVYGDPDRNIPGAVANGVTAEAANTIYDDIVSFASYAFNKSHAVCYAVIAYRTAYLKHHFPVEYMASLMSSVISNPDKLTSYIAEANAEGIGILPPDINQSEYSFSVDGQNIRFAICALKGVGEAATTKILEERSQNPFSSLYDFIRRTKGAADKSNIEMLIKSGAMDCFKCSRSTMLDVFPKMMEAVAKEKKKNLDGQISFFDADDQSDDFHIPDDIPELSEMETLRFEKEALGFYLSGHPIEIYSDYLPSDTPSCCQVVQHMEKLHDGQSANVEMVGIVSKFETIRTKSGKTIAKVTLEDTTGILNGVIFSAALDACYYRPAENEAVYLTGKISMRNGNASFAIQEISSLDERLLYRKEILYLKVPTEGPVREHIIDLFQNNVGPTKVIICDKADPEAPAHVVTGGYRSVTISMMMDIRKALPEDSIVLKAVPTQQSRNPMLVR